MCIPRSFRLDPVEVEASRTDFSALVSIIPSRIVSSSRISGFLRAIERSDCRTSTGPWTLDSSASWPPPAQHFPFLHAYMGILTGIFRRYVFVLLFISFYFLFF